MANSEQSVDDLTATCEAPSEVDDSQIKTQLESHVEVSAEKEVTDQEEVKKEDLSEKNTELMKTPKSSAEEFEGEPTAAKLTILPNNNATPETACIAVPGPQSLQRDTTAPKRERKRINVLLESLKRLAEEEEARKEALRKKGDAIEEIVLD